MRLLLEKPQTKKGPNISKEDMPITKFRTLCTIAQCCGDRWSTYYDEIDINKMKNDRYKASVCDNIYHNAVQEWEKKYGKFTIVEKPRFKCNKYSNFRSYVGSISFASIEEYAQYLANAYGWTVPDARIFYKDGNIKEIFKE